MTYLCSGLATVREEEEAVARQEERPRAAEQRAVDRRLSCRGWVCERKGGKCKPSLYLYIHAHPTYIHADTRTCSSTRKQACSSCSWPGSGTDSSDGGAAGGVTETTDSDSDSESDSTSSAAAASASSAAALVGCCWRRRTRCRVCRRRTCPLAPAASFSSSCSCSSTTTTSAACCCRRTRVTAADAAPASGAGGGGRRDLAGSGRRRAGRRCAAWRRACATVGCVYMCVHVVSRPPG